MQKYLHKLVALLLCCFGVSAHAQFIVLKAGQITEGLGIHAGYTDYAPLTSFQVGIEAQTSWTKGGGASVGKPNPLDVEITKVSDAFSNIISLHIATGKAFPKFEILWLMPGANGGLAVANKVELEGVFITSVMNSSVEGCTSGCPVVAESYKMVYKTYKRTIYKQLEDGSWEPANVFAWDIPAGMATN